eukprot:gb/GFBE01024378.1/.p1 GENE.gb/GFBE01024378.1/~~gb/GFBE01024378.1/.p1  ORF type:complete len:610 (+),score=142.45 gb/GFBE01024378.1/:1-1830(+)
MASAASSGQMPLGYPVVPQKPAQPMTENYVSLRKKLGVLSSQNISNPSSGADTALPNPLSEQYVSQSLGSIRSVSHRVELSDSESECDPLSDDDGDEDDSLAGLQLHHLHTRSDQSTSAKRFAPKYPQAIPGCTTVQQLAEGAARDFEPCCQEVSCALVQGKLLAASENFTLSVPLVGACVAVADCADGMKVIAIVSQEGSPVVSSSTGVVQTSQNLHAPSQGSSISGRISRVKKFFESTHPTAKDSYSLDAAAPDVRGWLFTCPADREMQILAALGECGCFRSGLQKYFDVDVGAKVGAGTFATVIRGMPVNGGAPVAVKMLRKNTKFEKVLAEVQILALAQGGDSIAKFRGCFCSESNSGPLSYNLVFDYCPGGDLYDRVAEGRVMLESDAMGPMYNILCALSFLHKRNIFHRDVKPENILLTNAHADNVVLTDFGISILVTDVERMAEKTGTVGYASPEMLLGEATGYEGDAFSAGIVLYFMLSKSTPFVAPEAKLITERTHRCNVNLDYTCFDHITKDCRSLILGLVTKDIKERMTVDQALAVRTVRSKMAAITEPALATMTKPKPKCTKQVSIPQQHAGQPPHFHHSTVGALPPLKRVPQKLDQ